jgi:hypothetical protein
MGLTLAAATCFPVLASSERRSIRCTVHKVVLADREKMTGIQKKKRGARQTSSNPFRQQKCLRQAFGETTLRILSIVLRVQTLTFLR